MTHFCAGEDSWLAHRSNGTSDPGTSEVRYDNGKPRRNKHKRRSNNENTEDTAANARFSGSKPDQQKRPFKGNKDGPSSLNRILDRPCQIHGTPDKPANHTNRNCWVFKHAGKLNIEHKGKGPPSEDDNEEPRPTNSGGKRNFPRGQNSEHDLCHSYPLAGAQARTKGHLRHRASRPKIQPMVILPDHF